MGFKHIIFLLFGLFPLLMGFSGCERDTTPPPEEVKPFVRLLTKQTMKSRILKQDILYSVLLPKDYDSLKLNYPVVYLLHGFGDNETAWTQYGLISYYADANPAETVPMIYVMPQGFNSYWVNKYNGNFNTMNMLVNEMVPKIDSLFRTIKDPQHRAVMGFSMGGYGALILPAMHPEIFSISVPLSMSFRTDEQYMAEPQSGWNSQWGAIFGGSGKSGEERLTNYFKMHSPFYFFAQSDLTKYSGLKIFMDCGDDEESLHITNGSLHNLMRDRKIQHEYRVRNGGHSWDYWHGALPEALKFISSGFSGKMYPENPEPESIGNLISSDQYNLENLNGSDVQLGIFKPSDYSSNTNPYPIIFWLHDFTGSTRNENATKVLSFLNNGMKAGTIPQSLVVEIPEGLTEVTSSLMTAIINQISTNYRIVSDKKGRVLMGNEQGGADVCKLIPDFQTVFNGCFLFNAKLEAHVQAVSGVYYYIDVTDRSDYYQGNFDLFADSRSKENGMEYRVRQGTTSLQSTINGLKPSLFYLSKNLRIL